MHPKTRAEQVERAWIEFHRANPQVFRLFCRYADQFWTKRGYVSVALVFERVRWEIAWSVEVHGDIRINNNHRAYYARLYNRLRKQERFQTRALTTQDHPPNRRGDAINPRLPAAQEDAALTERLDIMLQGGQTI